MLWRNIYVTGCHGRGSCVRIWLVQMTLMVIVRETIAASKGATSQLNRTYDIRIF